LLAAVGLDPRRREEAEGVLVAGMRDPGKSLRHRTEIAWALLDFAEEGSPAQRALVEIIPQGLDAEEKAGLLDEYNRLLLASCERMPPRDTARLLTQALAKKLDGELAGRLADVAERLEPAEAASVCARTTRLLAQALKQETNPRRRMEWAVALA